MLQAQPPQSELVHWVVLEGLVHWVVLRELVHWMEVQIHSHQGLAVPSELPLVLAGLVTVALKLQALFSHPS